MVMVIAGLAVAREEAGVVEESAGAALGSVVGGVGMLGGAGEGMGEGGRAGGAARNRPPPAGSDDASRAGAGSVGMLGTTEVGGRGRAPGSNPRAGGNVASRRRSSSAPEAVLAGSPRAGSNDASRPRAPAVREEAPAAVHRRASARAWACGSLQLSLTGRRRAAGAWVGAVLPVAVLLMQLGSAVAPAMPVGWDAATDVTGRKLQEQEERAPWRSYANPPYPHRLHGCSHLLRMGTLPAVSPTYICWQLSQLFTRTATSQTRATVRRGAQLPVHGLHPHHDRPWAHHSGGVYLPV